MAEMIWYFLFIMASVAWVYEFGRARTWRFVATTNWQASEHWKQSAEMYKAAYEEQRALLNDMLSSSKEGRSS